MGNLRRAGGLGLRVEGLQFRGLGFRLQGLGNLRRAGDRQTAAANDERASHVHPPTPPHTPPHLHHPLHPRLHPPQTPSISNLSLLTTPSPTARTLSCTWAPPWLEASPLGGEGVVGVGEGAMDLRATLTRSNSSCCATAGSCSHIWCSSAEILHSNLWC